MVMKPKSVWLLVIGVLFLVMHLSSGEVCLNDCKCSGECSYCRKNNITIICLTGSKYTMGVNYGKVLKNELSSTLKIMKEYFINEQAGSYEYMCFTANRFHLQYSAGYNRFLSGIADGSGLSLQDVRILNAMEVVKGKASAFSRDFDLGCAFVSVPPSRSKNGNILIGRNYDYFPPFDKISQNLVVAILKEIDKIPSAIITMPGQIYCPTCLNSMGVFTELNNGGTSGGPGVYTRQTLLISMLENIQNSENFEDLRYQYEATAADRSLILNTANASQVASFEFSAMKGLKLTIPGADEQFVSTNFFLNNDWGLPPPIDNDTWTGVTRRNNLLKLLAQQSVLDTIGLKNLLGVKLADGGAKSPLTIYQIMFEPSSMLLSVKQAPRDMWTDIDLKAFDMSSRPDCKISGTNKESLSFAAFIVAILLGIEKWAF